MKQIREDYNHTINACYIGFITQAIVNNLVPLLFLTFQRQYGFTLDEIAFLVSLNFGVQLLTDACAPRIVDKMGERGAIMAAHLFSGAGLLGLSFLPKIVWDPYVGIAAAIVCYAVGGGLIEVMVSPIVEACPTKRKEAAMSLLHSFYCWGHVAVILLSTAFFAVFGTKRWDVLACLWAVIPLLNTVYFRFVPIFPIVEEGRGMTILELAKKKIFWILFLVMIAAGAAEQGMSQWASAFAEAGLGVEKTVGDLAGPCMFAVFMGVARAFYGKYSEQIPLRKYMLCSGGLCIAAYLLAGLSTHPAAGLAGCALCGLSVGIMWPGAFSTGAAALPRGGTAMFALFALAGDLGCSAGPGLVGMVSEAAGNSLKMGLLSAVVFPVLLMVGISLVKNEKKNN
ncbi:MFS transporter [Sellimonas caecigallum]|uniref:MFS transporter n=1 Tax=Sellimonas caecigallum TaxID=2592333 RepID=A0ABS7L9W0_9FIRM|nr:MFS transporter [Sellimonas caecigallum]MBY0759757.1 MFS transporter [Sellimonas caecigallum]